MSEITGNLNTEPAQVEEAVTEPVEKMISQSQFNAALQDRLAKKDAQYAKELLKAKQDGLTEGQKLAKMNAEDRARHDLEEKLKDLTAREQELTKGELRAEAIRQFGEKGLPVNLAKIIPYIDADSTNAAIVEVEAVFREALEIAVTDRLKGTPPKIGQPQTQAQISQADASKMSYNERAAAYKKDPANYAKIFERK